MRSRDLRTLRQNSHKRSAPTYLDSDDKGADDTEPAESNEHEPDDWSPTPAEKRIQIGPLDVRRA